MTISPQMKGKMTNGTVVLFCGHCGGPAIDAVSDTTLKVCSTCGSPLGEWNTAEERDAELTEFADRIRLHSAPAKEKTGRAARGKSESKSKDMSFRGSGRKKKPKYGRKRGYK